MEIEIRKDVTPTEFFNSEALSLIKNKIRGSCKGNIQDHNIDEFLHHAAAIGLNPLKNQIHALPFWDKDSKSFRLVPQTSIDGLRAIAHRTGQCNGIKTKCYYDSNGNLAGAKAVVVRSGFKYYADVKYSEYSTGFGLWISKKETMTQKVAEAHGLRRAFPEYLSGIYSPEEFDKSNYDNKNVEITEKNPVNPPRAIQKPTVWNLLNTEAKRVKELAVSKGIDLANGFAPELISSIRASLAIKDDSEKLKSDIVKLEGLVNDFQPKTEVRHILFDDVAEYATINCNLTQKVFLETYSELIIEYKTCKDDNNIDGMEKVLYDIMDELRAYNKEEVAN